MADIRTFSGLRALVVGLGREGTALAAYLAGHGLTVTATDTQPAKKLAAAVPPLEAAGVSLVLGQHPLSLLDAVDILFVSPGIPLEIPFLQEARARELPLSTESRLFCHLCPASIVAVTGSSGKTTTTTLVGKMLEAGGQKTWVGGNIGQPLIGMVDQITPEDRVVMELSSFQLEYFHAGLNAGANLSALSEEQAALLDSWSPPVAAILNITPNHLDRHPSMKQYARCKRAVIDYQPPDGRAIMNLDNDLTRTLGHQLGDRTRWFSLEAQMPNGAALVNNEITLLDAGGAPQPVVNTSEVQLRGRHNLSNILAACLLAREAGASIDAMRQAITTFSGVAHRLEWVRDVAGAHYYNDSISTSPERLVAALRSFDQPIVLLAGGRDKHLPWDEAARLMLNKVRQMILFGEATAIIAHALEKAHQRTGGKMPTLHRCVNLEEAVRLAAQVAKSGDVVLLSPGCASYDAFKDFAARGEKFEEVVLQL